MGANAQVGFSQRVRLEWLQRTAELAAQGYPPQEIKADLREWLRGQISVDDQADRSNREKVITILTKVWVQVSPRLEPLRRTGIDLVQSLPGHLLLVTHWGMVGAAYPFFAHVAETTGRLLRLQGSAAASQVQRRVREQLGERETVARAARRTLRCFLDWGVLQESGTAGVYTPASPREITDHRLAVWLMKACLHASGDSSVLLPSLLSAPMLFPFGLHQIRARDLEQDSELEVHTQGRDDQVVMLRHRGATTR